MILNSIKLRKVRENAKLSQLDLALLISVSQTTICEWEKKDHDVKLDYIFDISKKLKIQVEDLLNDGTTLDILNKKQASGIAEGLNVSLEAYHLQQELINSLKQNIDLLKEEIANLRSKVIDSRL